MAIILALLIYGNPNAPPIIEDGNLKLTADRDIKKSNIDFFKNNDKILTFNSWEMKIKYNGTTQRVFSYNRNDTLFNGSDSKKIQINDNEVIVTYFNDKKDPKEVSIIFTLNNNSLNYKIKGNFTEPEKFEGVVYGYKFNRNYDKIITPSDEVINNEGDESYTWVKGLQIPEINKNYQLMISNETMINVSGNFNSIQNLLKYQLSWPYVNANESLNINVQESIKINISKNFPITISTSEKISDGIHIYKNGTQITYLSPCEAIFRKNYKTVRLLNTEKYDKEHPNKLIFNYNNCEKITKTTKTTYGYEMNVSWVNESKDIREVGFNIKIYENKSYVDLKYFYRTHAYTSLKPLFYGLNCGRKYNLIKILKDDELRGSVVRTNYIKNEGTNKRTYESTCRTHNDGEKRCNDIRYDAWYTGSEDFPEEVVKIEANFSKIEHLFKYQLVRYYLKDPKNDFLRC